ncbi:AAA family ATPase [Polyangium sorediatum]|uniref:ATP-binding protein n=1 Tax=Polyangium sorediatum TaxID=889274 RepID=A0ABT6NKH7_9BACT|nr:ATP-binding protein [Polyangium sorediatum]MDI1428813.1 ATP-binding protein [Polyangium sorediatum]
MIERVYVDNVWSYVNFEWRPGPLAIMLGANGVGKTALLDILRGVQGFLTGDLLVASAFEDGSRTRWDRRTEQTIELDVRGNAGLYRYRLVVEHDETTPGKQHVVTERLTFDDVPLVEVEGSELRTFRDDGAAGARVKVKPTRSGVGALEPGRDEQRLAWFKQWVWNLWLLRPDPRAMSATIDRRASEWLEANLSNFSTWYLRQLAVKPGSMFKANTTLAKVLPGFLEVFEQQGSLHARFGDETNHESYRFDDLSDGQRALIALYVLRHAIAGPGKTLVVDEPDNYVSLREIQPWLSEITDLALTKNGPQIWLISHHPEVLNLLAVDYGWQFFREGTGPTRVKRFAPAEGLDAAETIARGWDDA